MELINLIQHRPRPGWNLPWFDLQFSPHSSPFVIGSDLFREHVRRSTDHDPFFIIFPFWQFWWLRKWKRRPHIEHNKYGTHDLLRSYLAGRQRHIDPNALSHTSYNGGRVKFCLSFLLPSSREGEGPLDVKGTISLPHSGLILLVLSGRIIGVNRYDPIKVVPQTCQTWNTSSINAYRTRA